MERCLPDVCCCSTARQDQAEEAGYCTAQPSCEKQTTALDGPAHACTCTLDTVWSMEPLFAAAAPSSTAMVVTSCSWEEGRQASRQMSREEGHREK